MKNSPFLSLFLFFVLDIEIVILRVKHTFFFSQEKKCLRNEKKDNLIVTVQCILPPRCYKTAKTK